MNGTEAQIRDLIQLTGKYEILQSNEEGMNAYSYSARHLPLDMDVFIKVYEIDEQRTQVFREPRFLIETTRVRASKSNLVEIHDAELLGAEYVLLAMEYVDGGSLLKRLEEGCLGQMDSVRITIGVLHGVAQLHGQCLLHRDIKPANVLLQAHGGGLWPKLGDFGSIARIPEPDSHVPASKHSALYVPPEGWEEPSRYCRKSDLYQVGMILHEMVNGALPYGESEVFLVREAKRMIRDFGKNFLEDLDDCDACDVVNGGIYRNALRRRLLAIGPTQPYVSKRIQSAIAKATNPDLTSRYNSATEFIGALGQISLPNWMPCEDGRASYIASGWKRFDWIIEPATKRSEKGSFILSRARAGTDNYRRYRIYGDIQSASYAAEKL